MAYLDMSPDILGNPEIPYECRHCPRCSAINWAAGKNVLNTGFYETDIIECWKCKKRYWIEPYSNEDYDDDNRNLLICRSVPDPTIPVNVLNILIDAAQEQYDDLQDQIKEENEPTLMATMTEIKNAIHYVKDFLMDGKLPDYVSPNYDEDD